MEEYPEEFDNTVDQQVDLTQEIQEELGSSAPYQKKPDSLFTLFKDVVKTKDSSKVGNLQKQELGNLDISVRWCQKIALIGEVLDEPLIEDFFMKQGEITLATSGSKNGWLAELFVSQKKFTDRRASSQAATPAQDSKGKWPWQRNKTRQQMPV